jgi:hypothetical protein
MTKVADRLPSIKRVWKEMWKRRKNTNLYGHFSSSLAELEKHTRTVANKAFEYVSELKYIRATVTNQIALTGSLKSR